MIILFTLLLLNVYSRQVTKKEVYDYSFLCGILNTLGYSIQIQRPGRIAKTFQSFYIASIYNNLGNIILKEKKLGGDLYKNLISIIHSSSSVRVYTRESKKENTFAPLTSLTVNGRIVDPDFKHTLSIWGEHFNERIKGLLENDKEVMLRPCNTIFKELISLIPNKCFNPISTSPTSMLSSNSNSEGNESPTFQILIPDYQRNVYYEYLRVF